MFQISYSGLFSDFFLQKIRKYTIDHDMTLLQVIISRYNIQKNQFSSDASEPKTIFICKKILSVPS